MSALDRTVTGLLAGCLVFYLLLLALDGAGIPWSPLALLAALGVTIYLAVRFARWTATGDTTRFPSDLGWGDAVALAALVTFALFSLTLWVAIPDFVYHWGIKGHRFHLERGIDFDYLARSWNWPLHPDYPNLLPILFAATAILGGGFREPVMMLWSAVWLAALLLSAREVLRRWAPDRFVRQAALAVVALVLAAFGIGHLMAAAADWMIALALMAAVPPLLAPPGREADLQIGCAAAFAAAAKAEGLPLAAFLVLVQLVRHLARTRPWSAARLPHLLRSALRLGLPTALVVLPWLAAVRHHGLFQQYNAGSFDWERASLIFPAMWDSVRGGPWHRLELGLALLPLLGLDRRLRPLAAVISLQLFFYLYVYFSARVDVVMLVAASFPRLVLHLLPAILVGAVIMIPAQKETAGISAGRS